MTKSKIGALLGASMAMASMAYTNAYEGLGESMAYSTPSYKHRSKTNLSKSQKKSRAKAKRAKQARKKNR